MKFSVHWCNQLPYLSTIRTDFVTLDDVTKSVLIVDKYGSWLHQWTENFKALRIPHLRSLMSAHACPYDHRSLEYYAESKGRGDELITLRNLDQRDKTFKGPYQVSVIHFVSIVCMLLLLLTLRICRYHQHPSLMSFMNYSLEHTA